MAGDRPGVDKQVSDARLLVELHLCGDNAVFASEIAESLEITTQRTRDRLNELADGPHVNLRKASGRNLYSLTEAGVDKVADVMRSGVDD